MKIHGVGRTFSLCRNRYGTGGENHLRVLGQLDISRNQTIRNK